MRTAARIVAALAFALGAPSALAGWWDEAALARPADVADLRRSPDRWEGVAVVLDVRLGESSSPATARTEERVVLLRPATGRAGAESLAARVRRGTVEDLAVRKACREGLRAAVRAVVREVAGGVPTVEILDVTVEGEGLTPEEDARARRAEDLLRRESPAAAEQDLRHLLDGRDYGRTVRASLWRLVGRACRDQRRFADAVAAFRLAIDLDPTHAGTVAQLAEMIERSRRPERAAGAAGAVADGTGTPIPVPEGARRLSGPQDLAAAALPPEERKDAEAPAEESAPAPRPARRTDSR